MGSATVATANAMLAGQEKTVTAPHAQTAARPALACCAAAGVTVSVGFVSALSLVPMELPVRNAPPVLIPALLKSKFITQKTYTGLMVASDESSRGQSNN